MKRGGALLLVLATLGAAPSNDEDVARARQAGRAQAFEWHPWSKETFDRARRERRDILFHGAALWCHWCHVMEETTYRDPEVGKLIGERFIAIRVDIDSRPDLMERYSDWGWPATVILSPDAEEVGKYRGYLPPEQMLTMLRAVEREQARTNVTTLAADRGPAPVAALGWIATRAIHDLDDFYDPELGGWGRRQKLPIGANVEVELRRHQRGDATALQRATFTLQQSRALIDPVWGGVYQYSTGGTWTAPHFEKLMTIQAASLEAHARAFALTRDRAFLDDARAISAYIERFLTAPDGTFYVNQDADVGAHDRTAKFVDGHTYYALSDAKRRALGTPWVDTHVYARENGLAIAALVTLHQAASDEKLLQRARRAADVLLKTHVREDGSVRRAADSPDDPRFLADAAALGRGIALLAQATGEPRYRDAAQRIAARLVTSFSDDKTGGFFDHTVDPAAAGVFARREKPLAHNVVAARFLALMSTLTGDPAHRERARAALAAVATPKAVSDQGRMIGELVLAIDDVGALAW